MSLRTCLLVLVAATAGFLLFGNALIVGVSRLVGNTAGRSEMSGVTNFEAVDSRLWRGAAPTRSGYRALAERGVTTVVDLRAERDVREDAATELGLRVVRIPIRDGQTPTPDQVDAFLATVRASPGTVFVHCGAGVGRTGTMAAAYLVEDRNIGRIDALRRNMGVGPPSLEQIAFVAGLERGSIERPGAAVVTVSRFLDGPRRIMHNLGV